ncbi:MAG: hypothetical protein JKX73_02025 [Flavobacteriales bacterium]|nr:hypothetical protein [Flavobacteriales bacterium]
MILRVFKNQRPTTLILLVLVALCLWSFSIIDTEINDGSISPSIYHWFIHFIEGVPYIQQFAAVAFIIIQAIMVNNIVMESQLISTRTYVPSLIYIVLMSSTPELLNFNPGLIGNFFLILMLSRLFGTYRAEQNFAKIFDAGLFLGLASTIYFPYVWMVVFGLAALAILRSFAWRDWVIFTLGMVVPYLFIGTYFFAFDDLSNLSPHFILFDESRLYRDIQIPYYYFPALILFISLLLLSAKTVFLEWRIGAIKVKKLLSTLVAFSVISTLLPLLISGLDISNYTALAVPLCIYLANYYVNSKRPIVTEISFLLLLASIVYLQIVTL